MAQELQAVKNLPRIKLVVYFVYNILHCDGLICVVHNWIENDYKWAKMAVLFTIYSRWLF